MIRAGEGEAAEHDDESVCIVTVVDVEDADAVASVELAIGAIAGVDRDAEPGVDRVGRDTVASNEEGRSGEQVAGDGDASR